MKLLGHELGLATHTIPLAKSEFKDWVVSAPREVVRLRVQIAHQHHGWTCTQPPAPFTSSSDEPTAKSSRLLVTASFGRILRKGQLELFSPGRRLNVHPSLLPHYRGPAPIQHALLNGEQETGVCVVEMLKIKAGAVDSGDVWGCRKTVRAINRSISDSQRLQARLANRGQFHLESITGCPGETGRRSSRLRSQADVTFQGLSLCDFFFFSLLLILPSSKRGPKRSTRN